MTKGRADELGAYRLVVRFGAEIMEEGFTSVPNLVLNQYAALGITGAEMLFIIHVWQFWWSERENPHPASRTLAERMGVDQRTIRNYTASLEAKGFLATRERIIPGEGQRANVYDFAKLLKAVTKAAKSAGKSTPHGAPDPRKESSGEGRKEVAGGRRKNVSAQRLKKRSGEGWKDDSALEYVVSDESLDEDRSNLRTASGQVSPGEVQGGEGQPSGPRPSETPPRALPDGDQGDTASAGHPPREELHRFAEVVAREFNDQAPFRATLSRLVNLYHRAGLPLEEYTARLDGARQRTQERTGAIRTLPGEQASHGLSRKNKMPYFFALFEEMLGLRESPPPRSGADVGEQRAGGESDLAVPDGGGRRPPWRPNRQGDPPVGRPAPLSDRPAGTPLPPGAAGEDVRLIKGVVSTFSRQFADYAAADVLGEWAVALWRGSRLSREHFLAAAEDASVQMLRDRAAAPSAARFQACLTEMLARPGGHQDTEAQDRREAPSSSAPAGDAVATPDGDGA